MNLKPASTILAFGLAAGLLASCATASRPAANPPPAMVWPPPPSEARVAYVQSLRGPRDIGQNPSFFRSLGHWITGSTGENLNLKKPFAIALDERGNLCITDTDARLVCFADFTHKRWSRYAGSGK